MTRSSSSRSSRGWRPTTFTCDGLAHGVEPRSMPVAGLDPCPRPDRRGYRVELLDASLDLLGIASRRCPGAPTDPGDLCTLSLPRSFDAVICRGVLNDLVTDAERDGAPSSFAGVLCNAGVVILDVRDSESSRAKSGIVQRKEFELLDGDRLVFTNTPVWSEGVIDIEEQCSPRRRPTDDYPLLLPQAPVDRCRGEEQPAPSWVRPG